MILNSYLTRLQNVLQVVSACEGGMVSIWDVDTGCQVLDFRNCHGSDELTAMSLDSTGRRLVTGSRAGEMKVVRFFEVPLSEVQPDLP